jgi:hypothetical protein
VDKVKETPQVRYIKQLLRIIEKELIDNESKLRSAEVNIRRLKEERRDLLKALRDLEVMELEAVSEDPKPNIPFIRSPNIVGKPGSLYEGSILQREV